MKSLTLGIAALGVVLVIGAAAALAGVVPLPFVPDDGDRPPCAQLAASADVVRAIDAHPEFVHEIEAAGPDTKVKVGRPCGDQDRALVSIHVGSDEEHDRVDRLLREGDGFGVAAEIVRD